VQREVTLDIRSEGRNTRTDIRVLDGSKTYCVDIAVVNPAADKYKDQAYKRPGVASSRAYKRKIAFYQKYKQTVVPFVFEAAGRLDPRSLDWFKKIIPDPHRRSYYLNLFSAQIACYNAKMVNVARRLCRPENY
jgi:hypothetical protein